MDVSPDKGSVIIHKICYDEFPFQRKISCMNGSFFSNLQNWWNFINNMQGVLEKVGTNECVNISKYFYLRSYLYPLSNRRSIDCAQFEDMTLN